MDVDLLTKYHRKLGLVLGKDNVQDSGGINDEGDWPIFADYRLDAATIGESKAIMDAAYIHVSRLMSSDGDAEFPQVPRIVAEARKEFFRARSRDDYGELQEDIVAAFQDGLLLGRGVVEAHMVDVVRNEGDPFPGKFQKVCLTHYPLTHVCFDPYERNVTKGRFIALMRLVRLEDAEAKWGKSATDNVRTMLNGKTSSTNQRKLDVVPVTTYYDIDEYDGRAPTRAVVLGNVGNKPVEIEESGFDFLPVGLCLGFLPSGMGEHIGAFDRMIAIQEAINEWERKMRARMNQPDLLFIDPSQMDAKDVQKLVSEFKRDFRIHVIRQKLPQGDGFKFEAAPGITEADIVYGRELKQMRAEASGLSEIDRGSALEKEATKFEIEQVQQSSSMNASGPKRMAIDLVRRTIDVTLKVAAVYDTDPVQTDIDGVNVLMNDPAVPESSIAEIMRERSRTVVGTDTLTVADDKSRRMERYSEIKDVAASFPMIVNPQKAAEEAIKVLKITENTEDWIAQPPAVPGAPGHPPAA